MSRALILIVFLSGCVVGEIGGALAVVPPPEEPPPEEPPPMMMMPEPDEVAEVPVDVEALATTSSCTPLAQGERPITVSPEGHLWIAHSRAGTTEIRVLEAHDLAGRAFSIAVEAIQDAQAWTATSASLIADDSLFTIHDGARTSVSSPIPIVAGARLCGDLASRALVLSGGRLVERTGDQWIEWSGLDGVLTSTASLLTRDGACWGADDQAWFDSGRELWRLGPTSITEAHNMVGADAAALSQNQLLVLKDDHLFVGPTLWKEWSFAAGTPRLLATAGSYAWLVVGDQLLRRDGDTFARVEVDAGVRALHPYASGGVWVETTDEICHVAPATLLEVRGLANGAQQTDEHFQLRARATADTEVHAELDGQAIEPASVTDGWFIFDGNLGLGWRSIALSAGGTRRDLSVKRLPATLRSFETDIRPIYDTHCSGGACHIAGSTAGAPDFSRYDAWTVRADRLRLRIVERQDMPPVASRRPDWGNDQITIINEWLSGGLRP